MLPLDCANKAFVTRFRRLQRPILLLKARVEKMGVIPKLGSFLCPNLCAHDSQER